MAISTKSTTAGRERRLRDLHRADSIGRNDAVGAGFLELLLRILSLGARDDEQVGLHDTRGEDRVHVLGISADGRHEAAGALDAQSLQGLLAARVPLNGKMPLGVGVPHPSALRSTTTYGIFCRLNSFATIDPIRPKPQIT